MKQPTLCAIALIVAVTVTAAAGEPWRGVLLEPEAVTIEALAQHRRDSVQRIALLIGDDQLAEARAAATRVEAEGLELNYWFEIGRHPELANAHPDWMASIQGHQEWRRFFPEAKKENDGQVVKAFPWVPVAYAESFNAHSNRVKRALAALPKPAAIWLNDLQGPPAVCGCGHPLCRWTTDYGPKRTATALGDRAAADFVRAVQSLSPGTQVIPVWATECEAHDQDGLCGGVGCFTGRCWKDWTQQLMPLAEVAPAVGVLATYKVLQRDLPNYGSPAAWVGEAVRSFQVMPPQRNGRAVAADRLIAVVQGWNVTAAEVTAQIEHAGRAGARGVLVAVAPLEQSWTPRLLPWAADRR